MTDKKTAALELALEDLLLVWKDRPSITAIREALAVPAGVSWERFMSVEKELLDMTAEFMRAAGELVALKTQQQEPVAWMEDCADFWEHYTYISEASQENYKAEAQMWVEKLRTSPQPSKPWVGLTDEELEDVWPFVWRRHESVRHFAIYHAIEAKLKEKNA